MANGYIGKISAIVTASTADLERKLRGAKGEVERFGRSLNSTIASASRSAENSLNGIFTPLQKLQRALQAGSGRLRLIDPGDIAKIQRTVQITEDLNKPLAAVSRQFTGLSRDIAAEFAPALRKAQTEVLFVNNTLANLNVVSERTFNRATQTVNQTTAAIKRLREAQSLVSSGPSTRDLAFTAPGVTDALRTASARRQQVSLLPAAERAGATGQLRNLENVEQKIVQLQSRLESLRLSPKSDKAAIRAVESEIQRLIDAVARIDKGFQLRVDAKDVQAAQKRLEAQALADAERRAKVELDSLIAKESAQKRLEAQALADAERRAKVEIDALVAREAAQKRLEAQALADAERRAKAEIDIIIAKESAQKRLEEQALADAERRAKVEIDALITKESAQKRLEEQALADAERRAKIETDSLIAREAAQKRLEEQALADAERRAKIETDSLIAREAAQKRLEEQALADAERRAKVEIDAIIAKESAQKRLEEQALADAERRAKIETDSLIAREAAQKRLESQSLADAERRAKAEIDTLIAKESAQKRLEEQALADAERRAKVELDALIAKEAAQKRLETQALADAERRAKAEIDGLIAKEAAQKRLEAQARADIERRERAEIDALIARERAAKRLEQILNDPSSRRRIGDVGRLGFDRFSLAIQQTAFAVDDFFSVTGGLDQRIRAAGNNISQLGFILGGTAGLIAGISLTIGAQLVNALVKYVNQGRSSEDITKALNDSLEKQITIADELKRAFDGLTDTLLEGGFSKQAEELRSFKKELDEVNRLLRESREERVVELDEGVVRARADVAVAQNRLRGATTPAQALAAQEQLRQAQERERQARERITQGGPPELNQVFDRLIGAVQAQLNEVSAATGGGFVGAEFERGQRNIASLEQARLRAQAAGTPREAAQIQLEAARAQLADVRDGARGSIEAARQFEQVIRELELRIQEIEVDNVAVNALEQSSAAQRAVATARGRIDGSSLLSRGEELDRASEARERAVRQVEAARQAPGGVEAREAAIAAAVKGLEEADRQAIEVANKFSSLSASVETFKSVLDRVSNDLANTVAQEARSAADQARRDENAAEARSFGVGGARRSDDQDFAFFRRVRLDIDARRAERRAREVEQENARARQQFEKDALDENLGAEAQALVRQRDEAQAVLDDQKSTADQRAAATRSRDDANAQLDRGFEDSPEGRAARDRADRADVEAQQAALRDADILRGRELAETPAARAGRELADNLLGLERYFEQEVDDGRLDQADADAQLAEARRRQISEAFRSQAPAIAGLADSVANAVLQGPSRAALNATDVSTVEGASELNRLIRGDDAARDQNLEELRRQSGQLDQLIQAVKDNGGDVAN